MKILYIHQYFRTPQEGGAIRSFYLAKSLVENGFEVEMITSKNQKKYQIKYIEGIKVHELPIYYSNSLGFVGRIWAFGRFMWLAYRLATKIKNIDVVYATSTPLTVGILAYWLKQKKKIPYFFEVRDLWPAAPIALGFIRNGFLQKYLQNWEKKIYQNASKIIALSPAMQKHIQEIVPQKSVLMLPNMADTDFFEPTTSNLKKNTFQMLYFGTIGFANHLEYLLEIADFCQKKENDKQIKFLIVGEGKRKMHMEQQAKAMQLKNIEFLEYQDKFQIQEILNQVDFTYTSFLNKPILKTNSPNKFFDSLAAGKVCIVNTKGWLKDVVEQHECGFYANPENPQEFLDKLQLLLEDSDLLQKYQSNARKLAEGQFSRKIICEQFIDIFSPTPNP